MDTQLDWLSSMAAGHDRLAPPPVSFGSSTPALPNNYPHDHLHPYPVPSALADNLRLVETHADTHRPHVLRDDGASGNDSVPLSLTAQELTLEESKTYMRWYLDILARTNQRTITMNDVYHFLSNFRLSADVKQKINRIFVKILALINIGEFFALLRVVSHTLEGKEPTRLLVRQKAPVPVPVLILLKKRHSDDNDELQPPPLPPTRPAPPLDLDLFTQFMLTGQRPDDRVPKRLKKLKSVKFSDQIVSDVHDVSDPPPPPLLLDYSLPMDQLMLHLHSARAPLSPDPEEKQILADMEPQINHFRNLHSVDTMLVDGVPANIHVHLGLPRPPLPNLLPAPLQPNMTGPAQMRHMADLLPLRPNVTGPADMARFAALDTALDAPPVSLQSFTAHMTPDTAANTDANARLAVPGRGLDPVRPPVPARRARSLSLPNPVHLPPPPIAFGAAPAFGLRSISLSPAPPPLPPKSPPRHSTLSPPPPPSRRRGSSLASSPTPIGSIDGIMANQSPLRNSSLNSHSTPNSVHQNANYQNANYQNSGAVYQNSDASSSTANILDDLKALQEEVDKIRNMAGGF